MRLSVLSALTLIQLMSVRSLSSVTLMPSAHFKRDIIKKKLCLHLIMQFKGLTLLWQDFIAFHAPCGTVLKFVVYNSRIYDVYVVIRFL